MSCQCWTETRRTASHQPFQNQPSSPPKVRGDPSSKLAGPRIQSEICGVAPRLANRSSQTSGSGSSQGCRKASIINSRPGKLVVRAEPILGSAILAGLNHPASPANRAPSWHRRNTEFVDCGFHQRLYRRKYSRAIKCTRKDRPALSRLSNHALLSADDMLRASAVEHQGCRTSVA